MKNYKAFPLRFLSLVIAALCANAAHAQIASGALPTGGTVVGGQASIAQNGTTLHIHQTTHQALINFSTFNVGSGAVVDIRQPGAAASLLARVTGQDPSQIYGQITANGSLWLVNPSGILVGQGARIDVGGFVASTLNVSDSDFLAGRLNFTSPGGAGAFTNAGTISAASGGRIYLVAPQVENTGTLNAPHGEVLLAAARQVQLVDTGSPGVSITLSGAAGDVKNMGRIVAEAGRIGLGGALVANAGEISASSAVSEGGRVFLRAADLHTSSTSRISADGTSGGHIVLAADRADTDGRISATGSAGAGGFVETSGHVSLQVRHAPRVGKGGEWLIDPSDLEVVSGAGGDATSVGGVITSSPSGTTIGASTISDQLDQGVSVVLAMGAGGAGQGNIVVNAAIAKSSGEDARLTLRAHNNIEVNAPITSTAGRLDLDLKTNFQGQPADTGHAATLNADVHLNGGRLDVSQGEAQGNGTLNIAGGRTTLAGGSTIGAAAVNVGTSGAMTIDSAQSVQGAWSNAGRIELTGDGALDLTDASASFVNHGTVALLGSNANPLSGSTSVANLTNRGEIVAQTTAVRTIRHAVFVPASRVQVQAGTLSLEDSTVGGAVGVAAGSDLVLRNASLGGGIAITGAGTMMFSGSVSLLGDVTLGATAPQLRDDTREFFTFIQGTGHRIVTYNTVTVGKNLVLREGTTWDNYGMVTVGSATPGVLALDTDTTFNNKAGGVLAVKDGSRLELTQQTVINNDAGSLLEVDSSGTSSFSGGYQGTLNNRGTIVKTGAGTTPAPLRNLAGGIVRIREGGWGVAFTQTNANAGTIEIASGASLSSTNGADLYNAGKIRGTGTVDVNSNGGNENARLVNLGIVAPGQSDQTGTLTINGGYLQGPTGALNVRLDAAGADRLDVNGAVQLGGTLHLSNLQGVQPAGTTADAIRGNNAGRAGTFATVTSPSVTTGASTHSLSVVYPATGTAVAQVQAVSTPVVVQPPVVVPPVVVPPELEPPVVIPPVVTPPVTPPLVNPPGSEPPVVIAPPPPPPPPPPVVTTPPPAPTPVPAPGPGTTQPVVGTNPLDVCSVAPSSDICAVLRPSAPMQPPHPQLLDNANTVMASILGAGYVGSASDGVLVLGSKPEAADSGGAQTVAGTVKTSAVKKMYCN